ncbi:MAG: arginine--tRNA ligase [Ndongobacter sp.]|nr:arginine--tRNA ligase [Ndongobacter sp.]
MKDFRASIAKLLVAQNIGLEEEQILRAVETPPTADLGDYAFPCFALAKVLRKSPQLIAEELAQKVRAEWLSRVEAKGAYLNFYIAAQALVEETLGAIYRDGERYGASDEGAGKTVCIDFSSTNIAKPFHIGHIRSTVQGDAIASIYEFLGYRTVRINYLGDYGTQFGMLINAYRMWGDEQALEADPIHELLRLYVRYNAEAKENAELQERARDSFHLLEQGREEETALWKRFKELSLREFQRVYDLLNIRFDSWDGEFYHSQFIGEVLSELKEKELLVLDDHAMIIPLGEEMPPALILKSNGSSTYITRDIATACHRKKVYDFDESIYVVGTQQNLHFRQLKAVLHKMGYDWADQVEHVPFGMISLKDGAMSTRSGNVVFLEDVLNNSIQKTRQIMEERNPELENKDEVAKAVGIGAVKFQELYNNRIKDYTFSWEDVLNFDGESGPYVQYSAARANRVVWRAAEEFGMMPGYPVDGALLSAEEEHQLLRRLYDFPGTIEQAKTNKEPSLITRQVTEIAKAFNKFYNRIPVLNAPTPELVRARLSLVAASGRVIRIGLRLLGIASPDRM